MSAAIQQFLERGRKAQAAVDKILEEARVVARCPKCYEALGTDGTCGCAENLFCAEPGTQGAQGAKDSGRKTPDAGLPPRLTAAEHNAFPKGRWTV